MAAPWRLHAVVRRQHMLARLGAGHPDYGKSQHLGVTGSKGVDLGRAEGYCGDEARKGVDGSDGGVLRSPYQGAGRDRRQADCGDIVVGSD